MGIAIEKYISQQIKAVKALMKSKYQTIEKSTDLATSLLDKRLDTMNEFRQALKDQQATFVSRSEFEILHQRIIEDIRILREAKATTEGKASMASVYISYLIALIALAISIIRIFI